MHLLGVAWNLVHIDKVVFCEGINGAEINPLLLNVRLCRNIILSGLPPSFFS